MGACGLTRGLIIAEIKDDNELAILLLVYEYTSSLSKNENIF